MIEFVILTAAMLLAFAAAYLKLYMVSGALLILAGVVLYVLFYRRSGMLLDPAALFSVSWIGGMGVSALKLSRLQSPWEPMTWVCFYGAWAAFILAWFRFGPGKSGKGEKKEDASPSGKKKEELLRQQKEQRIRVRKRLFLTIPALTGLSLLAFLFEAVYLGYIPLFIKDTPHAYSYFHVTGVHYFTVSCVLVPSLVLLYLDQVRRHCIGVCSQAGEERGFRLLRRMFALGFGREILAALFCCGLSLCIPLLCVSRFQLIFAVALAVFTALSLRGSKRLERGLVLSLVILILLLIPVYIGLTVARAHDVAYLNGIFEMRDPDTPIFFTQPYMYIANNYDNFNCLVRELPGGGHTLGLRMLFPVFALTGMKFLFPALVSFPLYVTKTALTTVTLFYDAYYDFGLAGVLCFGALLGLCYGLFLRRTGLFLPEEGRTGENPGAYLIYAQLAFYLLFSFFTTWFSNPSTWFYLALSLLICLWLAWPPRKNRG